MRGRAQPPGMLGMSISRQVLGDTVELVSVTIWQDVDAMASVLGPGWREPAWLPGLADVIDESSVQLLETVATSYQELVEA